MPFYNYLGLDKKRISMSFICQFGYMYVSLNTIFRFYTFLFKSGILWNAVRFYLCNWIFSFVLQTDLNISFANFLQQKLFRNFKIRNCNILITKFISKLLKVIVYVEKYQFNDWHSNVLIESFFWNYILNWFTRSMFQNVISII